MKLLRSSYTAFGALVISVLIFKLADTGRYFGKWINTISPCIEDPMTSFPCYLGYDLAMMAVSGVVGILCALALLVFVYRKHIT
jgi:hypothetical protein